MKKKYWEILLPKDYDWKKIKGVPINVTKYLKEEICPRKKR